MSTEGHARSSRRRYRDFVEDYKHGRLDEASESAGKAASRRPPKPTPAARPSGASTCASTCAGSGRIAIAVGVVFFLALLAAGLQMVEPLFMRFIIDQVLLNTGARHRRALCAPAPGRARRSCRASSSLSNLVGVLKDYRQRMLNVKVMLSLRRSLFDRLLHLPLPKLWDMKTGGILSRLTGDVDTTTGLLQMAVVSPAISVIRLRHRDRRAADAQLAAGADGAGDHSGRDADELHAGAAGAADLSLDAQGRRADRRPRRRDVLRHPRRARLPPRAARAARLHAAAATRCCARSCSRTGASCCCGRRGAC